MTQITPAFLQSLGIQLPEGDLSELCHHIESTLHDRVINEISSYLTEDQATSLGAIPKDDQDGVWDWLNENVPDLKEIVRDEAIILISEVAESADVLSDDQA